MNTLVNISDSKKDLVKAGNAVKGFKDMLGEEIQITGIIIYEKEDLNERTGEMENKTVSCLKDANGEFITSVSPTVKNSLDMIIETYSEEEIKAGEVTVRILSKTSKGGRDFFYVDLV